MTKIILVRHGQSESNVSHHFACHFDSPLSALGRKQAEAVADYLVPRYKIDKVYASTVSRTQDTVRPTAERLGLTITPDAGLLEINCGEWENRPTADLMANDPTFSLWGRDMAHVQCPGGENMQELFARANATVCRIAEENEGKTLLLASHWTPTCAIVTKACGGDVADMQQTPNIGNASIHIFRYEDGKLIPEEIFITDHLAHLKPAPAEGPAILHPHLTANAAGRLTIGGLDTVALAREFGTPAYVMDEDVIRAQCRTYLAACRESFGADALPAFASKALSFTEIYRIMAEEGMGIDCVSGGELYTAKHAGFPTERIYFHGNNKTLRDLIDALEMGVGTVVVDNEQELKMLGLLATVRGLTQNILLRITPGIDPHTHRAIQTGNVDSKFGSAIQTGQAMQITKKALATEGVRLLGFHCHIGSQIFEIDPFLEAGDIMLRFIADVKRETGFEATTLNLGGGLGVRYTEEDPVIDYAAAVAGIGTAVRDAAKKYGVTMPRIILEPGRSIVAAAGITLYTVGGVKEIPGFKSYISVDGGMPDNPRYALYQSVYTAVIANRATEPATYRATLAGRCCESGDLIGEDMAIQPAHPGDTLAVLTTGAYNYAMASNYNRLPRPPVIFVKDGKARVVVRRESYEDLVRNDL